MISKTYLIGLSVAAVFAISIVGANYALATVPGPANLVVSSFSVSTQGNNLAILSATTGDTIPKKPDAFIGSHPVAGIAWADLDTGKVLVATIHPVLGRDSNQRPDSWHIHTATLTGGATAPQDFCVASIDSTPTAGINIQGSTISINIKTDKLPFSVSDIDGAVGFTIDGDAGTGCALGLAVTILS